MRVSTIGVEDGQRLIKEAPTMARHIATKEYVDATTAAAGATVVEGMLVEFQTTINNQLADLVVDVSPKAAVTLTAGQAADLSVGDYFILNANGNQVISFSNVEALMGKPAMVVFDIRNTSSLNITWGIPNLSFSRGVAITLTPNGRDMLGFITKNGGSSWDMISISTDSRYPV